MQSNHHATHFIFRVKKKHRVTFLQMIDDGKKRHERKCVVKKFVFAAKKWEHQMKQKNSYTHTHIEKLVSSVVSRRQINVWDYERDLGGVVVAAAAAAGMTTSATAHIECVGNVSRKLVQCE